MKIELLAKQSLEHHPNAVVISNQELYLELKDM